MARRKTGIDIDGWVIIDKPADIGSTPIVSKVRRGLNANKAGHAGTLDPFATGILPIALGIGTKTIPFIQDSEKEYDFTITFGKMTDTLDSEGIVIETSDVIPTTEMILSVLPQFIGEITQIPPAYSAIKIDGKRAYDLARSGQEVDIPSRVVTIKEINFLGWEESKDSQDSSYITDSAKFSVVCGKGTYVRSLGRDIAKALGTCGYLTALRRTRVGPYDLNCSFTLAKFEEMTHKSNQIDDTVLSIESALVGIPVLTVADKKARKFQSGQFLGGSQLDNYNENELIVVETLTEIFGFAQKVDGVFKPLRVFNNPVPKKG